MQIQVRHVFTALRHEPRRRMHYTAAMCITLVAAAHPAVALVEQGVAWQALLLLHRPQSQRLQRGHHGLLMLLLVAAVAAAAAGVCC